MSTRAIAGRLAAKDVTLVDAPVSGGVTGAEKGTLTVMTGGPSGAVDRVEPLLDVLGTVVRTGPVGSGHAVKALNNLMSATHLWVTSEAILAGERFGLDPQTMLAVFNRSSGRSGSTENKWPNFILPQTYNSGFTVQLMVKDMRIALDLIQQVGGPHALSSSATQLWATAAEELTASADHTEVARFLIHCASSRQQEPE
jgi:3-hydroxyisobutyrate dehydrogenase